MHGSTTASLAPAVHAVVSGIEATGRVQDVRAPVTAAGGRDGLIQFDIEGRPGHGGRPGQPVLDAVAAVRAAHPDVRVEQFGDASGDKWFNDTIGKDF